MFPSAPMDRFWINFSAKVAIRVSEVPFGERDPISYGISNKAGEDAAGNRSSVKPIRPSNPTLVFSSGTRITGTIVHETWQTLEELYFADLTSSVQESETMREWK